MSLLYGFRPEEFAKEERIEDRNYLMTWNSHVNYMIHQKLMYYKKENINITFRLKERPEYFFKGRIIQLKDLETQWKEDEEQAKEEERLYKKQHPTTKEENLMFPRNINYSNPNIIGYFGKQTNIETDYILLELESKENAIFFLDEISLTSIHPSSINPIQYFERKTIPDWKRDLIFERCQGKCELKLEGCTNIATEVDHLIPVSKGGSDDITNLRGSCSNCNKIKSDKIL